MNGYRFHTESHNESIQTYNCGVCVRMDDDDGENHYYGVLKEIYEYSFTNDVEKNLYYSSMIGMIQVHLGQKHINNSGS